jgi:4-hydroxythreonine-4-phosphate dehydrogenase
MKPIIAVTMGDPGGIGPEIILKSLREFSSRRAVFLVIGSKEVFQFAGEKSRFDFNLHAVPTLERLLLKEEQVNFLDITQEAEAVLNQSYPGKKRPKEEVFSIGEISEWNAALAFASLKVAAYQAACGLVQAVVTAPVNKTAIRLIEPKFQGHTEYLAKTAGVKEFAMMFVSDKLRVTLATIHLPLKKVSSALNTEDIVSKIKLTAGFLNRYLKIALPKIGVSALNPHGSEFGAEEDEFILPAVKKARAEGIHVEGPLPGDQVFFDAYEGRLDAVLAMYHDQGLAPFKMIAFREGVNVTLGLPYLRTSPDHGTAFDIAYQNKAFPTAFINSMRLAEQALS